MTGHYGMLLQTNPDGYMGKSICPKGKNGIAEKGEPIPDNKPDNKTR